MNPYDDNDIHGSDYQKQIFLNLSSSRIHSMSEIIIRAHNCFEESKKGN